QPVKRGNLAGEKLDDLRVPLGPGSIDKDVDRLLARAPRPVWAVVDKRVVCIADGHDSRKARDLEAPQAVGVAAAVVVLVMVADDRQQAGSCPEWPDDALTDYRMRSHPRRLNLVQQA